jgi:hypothetical protein
MEQEDHRSLEIGIDTSTPADIYKLVASTTAAAQLILSKG